jgi:hypothetical protein
MMNLPKEDKPGDIWARITSTPRPSQLVPFPRNDADGQPIAFVRLEVLTYNEQQQANAAAEAEVRTYLKGDAAPKKDENNAGYEYARREALQKHLLWRAAKKQEDPRPFFAQPNDIGQFLTPDEIGALVQHYLVLVQSTGPMFGSFESQEAMEAWAEAVARSGQFHPFALLSREDLTLLATSLASQRWNSAIASSSPGTSPEPTPTSSETSETAATSGAGS